jgi:hypothetical protein
LSERLVRAECVALISTVMAQRARAILQPFSCRVVRAVAAGDIERRVGHHARVV